MILELNETEVNNLKSAMVILMRLMPRDAERELFNQKKKKERENYHAKSKKDFAFADK